MKIIGQFISGLMFEAVFGVIGLILGEPFFGDSNDYNIGNAVGWEAGGIYLGAAGICLGALVGALAINQAYNIKIKNIYLYLLGLILFLIWLKVYSIFGSNLPLSLILIATSALFTLLNNLSFVKKLD